MGIIMASGIFTGVNPTYDVRILAHQLKDSGAIYLICASMSWETGIEAAGLIGIEKDRIFVFNNSLYDGPGEAQKGVPTLEGADGIRGGRGEICLRPSFHSK
jgi:4-coumarate--CoA ligase